jgi:hypothetical protein
VLSSLIDRLISIKFGQLVLLDREVLGSSPENRDFQVLKSFIIIWNQDVGYLEYIRTALNVKLKLGVVYLYDLPRQMLGEIRTDVVFDYAIETVDAFILSSL